MVANTKGYIMKNLLPISATQFPSPETSDGIRFLYVLCRNILCIYSRESHAHILLSLVQTVLFWNIVIHLDLSPDNLSWWLIPPVIKSLSILRGCIVLHHIEALPSLSPVLIIRHGDFFVERLQAGLWETHLDSPWLSYSSVKWDKKNVYLIRLFVRIEWDKMKGP